MRSISNFSIGILSLSSIFLIALQMHILGWLLWLTGFIFLLFSKGRKSLYPIYISIAILGITPVSTDMSYSHIFLMGTEISIALLIPYIFSRYLNKDSVIKYKFFSGKYWTRGEIGYIFFAGIFSYLFLPFFLRSTGSYVNWTVKPGLLNLTVLFLGTNFLGIWDELFFVNTVLSVFRRFMPFVYANIAQSVMFASFLYELGFRGWGFPVLFLFAFLQGVIFKKTESLLYVITVHLTLDLVLYLSLIHAHHPAWMPIFIIK